MMSLEKLKELEPSLACKTDEELLDIRDQIYELAQLAYDSYQEEKKEL